MYLSFSVIAGLAGFLAIIHQVLAKEIPSSNDVLVTEPRCLCTVNIDDNESAFDLGEVHRFSDLDSEPALDKTQCRKLRHQCRHECSMSADLSRRLPSGSQLGFSLCVHHRQVTDHNGVGFSSYATLEGCPQHLPIAPTVGEQKLCCGHTGISMKSEYSSQHKTYYVLGWNPDCLAETFIIH